MTCRKDVSLVEKNSKALDDGYVEGIKRRIQARLTGKNPVGVFCGVWLGCATRGAA